MAAKAYEYLAWLQKTSYDELGTDVAAIKAHLRQRSVEHVQENVKQQLLQSGWQPDQIAAQKSLAAVLADAPTPTRTRSTTP